MTRMKERLSTLHPDEERKEPGPSEQWLAYLESLQHRGLATTQVIDTAVQLWRKIAGATPNVIPPNARPTEDNGLRLSWNRNGGYLEILVGADGTFEWFYTDSNDAYESGEGLRPGAPLNRIIVRLFGVS
jgi:hypothetical protein